MQSHLHFLAASHFQAARSLGGLPEGHRAARLHGHGFVARISVDLPQGWGPCPGGEVEALEQRLSSVTAELDYRHLNRIMDAPSDENLARWIRDRLHLSGLDTVGVQSTAHQGVDLDRRDHAHIWRRFRFEAAHRLPRVKAGHPCGRMHGHGFEVILHADQDLARRERALDPERLQALWVPLQELLHHACLNEIQGLENPTSEMLADWLWRRLSPRLPELSWVSVYETATAGCHYDGSHFRIWKERRFESALSFSLDARQGVFGHSYLLRLHLTAPLDDVYGWTVDYGDVKTLFEPLYRQLDHHRLDQLPGLKRPDVASLLGWIQAGMRDRLPALDRVDLFETPGCGARLSWGEASPALPLA